MSPMDGRDELRGRFTRWIVITAEHAQKNYLRAEKKQLQTVPLEEADVAIVDTALLSAGVTPDSFDFEEQRLAEAFRELPLMRRRILEMLFVEELTPSEIAAKLHCSVQHVYNQRSLAIKRLRERLIKEQKMTDNEFRLLLEAAVCGDREALDSLLALYMPLINRLSSYAGNLDEDCRQYIMLHIVLHISEFRI